MFRSDALDFLRLSSVKPITARRYFDGSNDFRSWCLAVERVLNDPNIVEGDMQLTRYLIFLYVNGYKLFDARQAVYGLQKLYARVAHANFAPLAKEALRGWSRRAPGGQRRPVAEELIFWISYYLVRRKLTLVGLLLMFSLDTYLRPSEALSLTRENLLPPAPALGPAYARLWGLILCPSGEAPRTKTYKADECLFIGDVARPWLSSAMQLLYDLSKPGKPLFPCSLAYYERVVAQTVLTLGLKVGSITPHVARHSGASADKAKRRRSLVHIKRRGRWAADRSLVRYEKEALILASVVGVPEADQLLARDSVNAVGPAILTGLKQLKLG